MKTVILLVTVLTVGQFGTTANSNYFLNTFAVQVHGGKAVVEALANQHGFQVQKELPNIGVFVLEHPSVSNRSKRSADFYLSVLKSHPQVGYAQQEVELVRVKRHIIHDKQLELPIREIKDSSVYHRISLPLVSTRTMTDEVSFNDPFFRDMWYLKNDGQSGGEKFLDLNVMVAWANGFNGDGVVVCILDDGIDHTHPDLIQNYDPEASADFNDKFDIKQDPMPDITVPGNSHGTRCAGEVAATADNKVCGVGIAHNARIGGIRLLDGVVTDSLEAEALRFNGDHIDIYSASWGPADDGKTMEAPHYLAQQALRHGVKLGRKGLGSIYVWATGNGGLTGDDCNADGYVSSIETLSVGSVTEWGRHPFYMEHCSSLLAVVPTGGEEVKGQEDSNAHVKLKVITTDVHSGCIENFQGTSSAAPLAAGCLANVLQANPSVSWRDVQHIVVHGTRIPSVDSSWTINGGGHHVSHRFGFGLMDCGKMVQIAQNWISVPEQHVCQVDRLYPQKLQFAGHVTDSVYVDGCRDDAENWIQHLEHVQVRMKLRVRRRGDIHISLTSPSGTHSELLSKRPNDDHQGMMNFTFMTVHCWDENPAGVWRLEIEDRPLSVDGNHEEDFKMLQSLLTSKGDTAGYIEDWSLIMYGTSGDRSERTVFKGSNPKAFKPSEEEVSRIKRAETQESQNVQVKRASTKRNNFSDNIVHSHSNSNQKLAQKLWNFLQQENQVPKVKPVYHKANQSSQSYQSPNYYFDRRELDENKSFNNTKGTLFEKVIKYVKSHSKERSGHTFSFYGGDFMNKTGELQSFSRQSKETNDKFTIMALIQLLKYLKTL